MAGIEVSTPSHKDIYELIGELSAKFDSLSERIGHEETRPDGKVIGTGLTGRVIRTEAKVLAYDTLKERVVGGFLTATVLLGVVWWLVRAKVSALFGVGAGS